MRAGILYTILRLGIFAALFALLYLLATQLWGAGLLSAAAAGVVAAIAAFCLSYIFFGRLRARVASEFAAARRPRRPKAGSDEDAEDRLDPTGDDRR